MAPNDSANPYQPPAIEAASKLSVDPPQRAKALAAVHWAICCLAPAAFANWACIQFLDISDKSLGPGSFYGTDLNTQIQYGGVNLVLTAAAFTAAWFWLLPMLEQAGVFLWFRFGRQTNRSDWMDALYKSLSRFVVAGSLGSVIWIAWLAVFFGVGNHSPVVTSLFAIAGHACGALIYVTVIFNWWVLRRADADSNNQPVTH